MQLNAAAKDTGLELLLFAVGHVKSSAPYSSMTRLHEKGPFVVPVETAVQDHRLVLFSHSTGGPVRRVMEQPCAIAGLSSDVPSDVKMLRAASQSLHALVHKVRSYPLTLSRRRCGKLGVVERLHAGCARWCHGIAWLPSLWSKLRSSYCVC